MIKKLSIALLLLLAAFITGGFLLPAVYQLEREVFIERSPATVFTVLNGYHAVHEWSPWAELDPGMEYIRTGPDAGVGARLDWSGDPQLVGSGWQEITASRPFELIATRLKFGADGVANSQFNLQQTQSGTLLTWRFDMDVTEGRGWYGSLMARYFGLLIERWVGSAYERGLARLKTYVESLPVADFSDAEIELVDPDPVRILYVSRSTSQDIASLTDALGNAYGQVSAFIATSDVSVAGQPMAITRGWDENGYRFDAAIPVDRDVQDLPPGIHSGWSPGGPALRIIHRGDYASVLESYDRIAVYMGAHGYKEGPVSWEHYVSDPALTPATETVTHIYVQLAE